MTLTGPTCRVPTVKIHKFWVLPDLDERSAKRQLSSLVRKKRWTKVKGGKTLAAARTSLNRDHREPIIVEDVSLGDSEAPIIVE